MSYKAAKWLKTILCIVLIFGVLAGCLSLFSIFVKKGDGKKRIYPVFSVGELDSLGNYVESSTAVYTKKAFSCAGLSIVLDFDSESKYCVYFYDENDEYIRNSGWLTNDDTFSIPLNALTVRIVIRSMRNDVNKGLSVFDAFNIGRDIKIRVNKYQPTTYIEKIQSYGDAGVLYKGTFNQEKGIVVKDDTMEYYVTNKIDTDGAFGVVVRIFKEDLYYHLDDVGGENSGMYHFAVYYGNENGNFNVRDWPSLEHSGGRILVDQGDIVYIYIVVDSTKQMVFTCAENSASIFEAYVIK